VDCRGLQLISPLLALPASLPPTWGRFYSRTEMSIY
jgi:hypothetical protein